jgi:hypothetical protein
MTRHSNPTSLRTLGATIVIALVASTFGCADGEFRFGDPFDRQLTLDEAHHKYTVFVRWADFKKARSFVAVDDRDAFMKQMDSLDEAHFTSYEAEPFDIDRQKQSATVVVTYLVFTPSVPYEVEIVETQEWTRDGVGNNWSVYSSFEGLQQLALN